MQEVIEDLNQVDVVFDREPDFRVGLFDVHYDLPYGPVNLFVYSTPSCEMLLVFNSLVRNECAYKRVNKCNVFSTVPIWSSILTYQGIVEEAGSFGPFHLYEYQE